MLSIGKTTLIALALHIIVFSFIWIGFPIIRVKDNVVFYYSQMSLQDPTDDIIFNDHMPIKAGGSSDSQVWKQLRMLDKPKR